MIRTRKLGRIARYGLALVGAGFLALHGTGCLILPGDDRLANLSQASTLTTNGFVIRYHLAESAAAQWNIVFVHGTPANAGIWHSQFKDPFPGANLIAYDRPGFGLSQPTRRDPHLDEQVSALTNLLAVMPVRPTLLVGHSYGGPVALLTAARHPELVAAVVLIGGSVDPGQEHPLWIQRPFHTGATSWVLPGWLRQCNRELMTLKSDLLQLETELEHLRVPVVMLHGGRDRQVPVENVPYLGSKLASLGKSKLFQ